MNKFSISFLFFGIIISSYCDAQSERVEIQFMNCVYENFEDKGLEFKKSISDFEQLLIHENILKGSDGENYIEFLELIVINNDFNYNPSKSFLAILMDKDFVQSNVIKECQLNFKNEEFPKNDELQRIFSSIKKSEDFTTSNFVNGILSVLNAQDFELDYYKYSIFILLETITLLNNYDVISRKLPPSDGNKIKYHLDHALNISIDKENSVYVNQKRVDINNLRIRIKNYEQKHKSNAVIALKAQRETVYALYKNVLDTITEEIKKIRQELAKEKYNTDFNHLTDDQKSEVKRIYPKKIIELE